MTDDKYNDELKDYKNVMLSKYHDVFNNIKLFYNGYIKDNRESERFLKYLALNDLSDVDEDEPLISSKLKKRLNDTVESIIDVDYIPSMKLILKASNEKREELMRMLKSRIDKKYFNVDVKLRKSFKDKGTEIHNLKLFLLINLLITLSDIKEVYQGNGDLKTEDLKYVLGWKWNYLGTEQSFNIRIDEDDMTFIKQYLIQHKIYIDPYSFNKVENDEKDISYFEKVLIKYFIRL